MKNNGLTPPAQTTTTDYVYEHPGEFERFMSFFISRSVETTMEKFFDKIAPKLYSIEQVAEILLIDEETVRRRCRSGAMDYHQEGKYLRISLRQLNEYLASTEIKSQKR